MLVVPSALVTALTLTVLVTGVIAGDSMLVVLVTGEVTTDTVDVGVSLWPQPTKRPQTNSPVNILPTSVCCIFIIV